MGKNNFTLTLKFADGQASTSNKENEFQRALLELQKIVQFSYNSETLIVKPNRSTSFCESSQTKCKLILDYKPVNQLQPFKFLPSI